MTKFESGQRVKVTFEATVAKPGGGQEFGYATPDAPFDNYLYLVNIDKDNIQTEVLPDPDPENWPPRVGDIWAVGDVEYYVRQNTAEYGRYVISKFNRVQGDEDYYSDPTNEATDKFKAFKPTLVRRAKVAELMPTSDQREEARTTLLERASFAGLEFGNQVKAVTDLLNAWHDTGEKDSIASFAYPWFKQSRYFNGL